MQHRTSQYQHIFAWMWRPDERLAFSLLAENTCVLPQVAALHREMVVGTCCVSDDAAHTVPKQRASSGRNEQLRLATKPAVHSQTHQLLPPPQALSLLLTRSRLAREPLHLTPTRSPDRSTDRPADRLPTTTSALSLTTMKCVSVLVGAVALAQAVLPSHGEQSHPTTRVALAGPPRMLRGATTLDAQPPAPSATDTQEDDESHKQHRVKTVVKKIAIPIPVPINVPQYIPIPISLPSTVIASDTSTSTVVSSNSVVAGGSTVVGGAVAGGPAGGVAAGGPSGLSGGGVPGATPAPTRLGERPQVTPAASVPQRVTPAPTTPSEPEPQAPAQSQAQPEPIGTDVGTGADIRVSPQLASNGGAQAITPPGSVGGDIGTTGGLSGSSPGGGAFGPGASFGSFGNSAGMGLGGMNQARGSVGDAAGGFANTGAASFGNGGPFGGAPAGFGGGSRGGGGALGGDGFGGGRGGNAGVPNNRWRRRRRL
ncbi:hypothetical protein PybrP1_010939 [[Pythium] brassicae (nom. inval.)]|nr:hypothetical protein PybrP1_010939 [[Pythium] brassicae (nom. inval.)]